MRAVRAVRAWGANARPKETHLQHSQETQVNAGGGGENAGVGGGGGGGGHVIGSMPAPIWLLE